MAIIDAEIQLLNPDAQVELYEIRPPSSITLEPLRFTASGNGLPLAFQGFTYEPWAIQASGFESSSKGSAPRPTLSVSNIATTDTGQTVIGIFTALVMQYQGLVGWTVIRRLTYAKFLEGGERAGVPEMHPEEIWLINRRSGDNGEVIEFELRSALDMAGRRAPGVLATRYCPAHVTYRGADCGYMGAAMFDSNDKSTSDPLKDICSKRLSGCQCRGNSEHFAGFPGMRRYS
ncbi:phage minor tail protein L [Pseudogulbenkiania sp. NH8B]|uniref:phage minor tail protein L n=1 Tax=Pseudogulbenkiania sp. (strain NH8B) TaxID=748280 RepID=UPI0002279A9B|nr:phage minor tail protein L [Pseudogulbenkiania sp. NH8B]BAK75821.1 phage minor tail protein L [Pseudogulbenkiania sp. NH8B]